MAVTSAITWLVIRSSATPADEGVVVACNGSPSLCDRRLDEVVFATTHNSMGDAEGGWMFPNQSAGVRRQLEDGIRAFLIDVHYGRPVGDRVRTELQDESAAMAKYGAIVSFPVSIER